MKPAVVIGTHTMGLGVIRALGMMGVPIVALHYDPRDMGYVSRYVEQAMCCPHPEHEEDRFLALLLELGRRYPGSPLFPLSDEALKTVSRHKPELEQTYRVACAEWQIVRQLLEKDCTYTLAASLGIPIPATLVPASLDEAAEFGRTLEYPCLVKPIESHSYFAVFRRKIVKANTLQELISACQEAEQIGSKVMLQELIPGDDAQGVNYNSYFWNGQAAVEFTAQKVRSAPPELGSPCVAYSHAVPDVLEIGRKMLRAVGFYGYSCTEFKRDPRDGVYKLMEINGRHNLSTLLAVRCGLNFPWLHYRHLVDGIIPEPSDVREGLYWIDVERDLYHLPRRILREKESLWQFMLPYFRPHVSAIYDAHDIKPFFKRYFDLAETRLVRPFAPRSGTRPLASPAAERDG